METCVSIPVSLLVRKHMLATIEHGKVLLSLGTGKGLALYLCGETSVLVKSGKGLSKDRPTMNREGYLDNGNKRYKKAM